MSATLTAELEPLSRDYSSRNDDLVIRQVHPQIFVRRYFTHCLDCTFCHDSCCQFGCDVDLDNVASLAGEHAAPLEAYLGIPREAWLREEVHPDAELHSGGYRRTQVSNGTCVFKRKDARGCGIHAYCYENGVDYHELKPTICWLFPICVDAAVLRPSSEILDNSLICIDQGLTLYRSQRQELLYLFGPELVAELDALEQQTLAAGGQQTAGS